MSSKWQPDIARDHALVVAGERSVDVKAQARSHIAALFQNLRRVMDRPLKDIANELGTSSHVIRSLETGDFEALPPWNETSRIVTAYTRMVAIDPRPALEVLASTMTSNNVPSVRADISRQSPRAHIPSTYPAAAAAFHGGHTTHQPIQRPAPKILSTTNSPRPIKKPETSVRWRNGLSGTPIPTGGTEAQRLPDGDPNALRALPAAAGSKILRLGAALKGGFDQKAVSSIYASLGVHRALIQISVGVVTFLIAVFVALCSPFIVRFTQANLPRPIVNVVLSAHNFLSPPKITIRDGMRWIEASEPRSRRTDKLPVPDE